MDRSRPPGFTPLQRVDDEPRRGTGGGTVGGAGAARSAEPLNRSTSAGGAPPPGPAAPGARSGSGSSSSSRQNADPRRRNAVDIRQRIAWIAGGTGLIGRSLLPLLLASQRYASVHALVRSQASALPPSIKLHRHRVDFSALPTTPSASMAAADDVYILLGTTIKDAGSETAFRRVDLDAVLATARAARVAGATRIAVVSALGADKGSRVFYNRIKGEMEHSIGQMGFRSVVVAQPSLLVGDRRALGQARRIGEEWSLRLMLPISRFIPLKWRPIEARTVARAMYRAMIESHSGVRVLKSDDLQELGR